MIKKFIAPVKKDFDEYVKFRKITISKATLILNKSKQCIFALHRNNLDEAKAALSEARKEIKKLEEFNTKEHKLRYEGSLKAALEEFVEADFFLQYELNSKISLIKEVRLEFDEYIGGLCDFSGELVRKAILQATKENYAEIQNIYKVIEEIIHELIQFNLVSHLRNKFDQAKRNLQRIETIIYELKLKDKI